MKVILLQDIRGVGKKYDIKDVSDGYARNSLIPQHKVEVATAEGIKKVETYCSQHTAEQQVHEAQVLQDIKKMANITLTVKGKVNEKGHLFAGIHADTLVKQLATQHGISLAVTDLALPTPLKEMGEHQVPVVHGNKKTTLKVVISAE